MSPGQTYCIDTSGLTAGYWRVYPAAVFGGVWSKIADLIEEGRLIAPEQVYKELKKQDDALYQWVKARRKMFVAEDPDQIRMASQITNDFPNLAKKHSVAKPADPWVVALASLRGLWVIHDEKAGSVENPKIPQLCRKYGVVEKRFVDIILNEGWLFP